MPLVGARPYPSAFELTDDERQLRDLAFPLIEPPYDRQQSDSVTRQYGAIGRNHGGAFDRASYANHLFESGYRSQAARYSQITDDIQNDITRLPQFFETAARVLDIDQKRQKSVAYISNLLPADGRTRFGAFVRTYLSYRWCARSWRNVLHPTALRSSGWSS